MSDIEKSHVVKIKSFEAVLVILKEESNPTLSHFMNKLKDLRFPHSERTCKRIINELRNDFHINIEYNFQKGKYELNEDDIKFRQKEDIINQLSISLTFLDLLKDSTRKINHIAFDSGASNRGIEFFTPLLKAIEEKRFLKIVYQSFKNTQESDHIVYPLFLKQYHYRWYLLTLTENGGNLLFCLDRIKKISFFENGFSLDAFLNDSINKAHLYFDDIIGITNKRGKIEKVILKFPAKDAPYIMSQPFHTSQIVLEPVNSINGLRICLHVQINDELKSLILSRLPNIEVIEPLNLRDELRETVNTFLNSYK